MRRLSRNLDGITASIWESKGLDAWNGIPFSRRNPLLAEPFLTHRIAPAISSLALGLRDFPRSGSLNAPGDWSQPEDGLKFHPSSHQRDPAANLLVAADVTAGV
jgi:GDP-D-mannose dehydratase